MLRQAPAGNQDGVEPAGLSGIVRVTRQKRLGGTGDPLPLPLAD
jgi:hypothetical protein